MVKTKRKKEEERNVSPTFCYPSRERIECDGENKLTNGLAAHKRRAVEKGKISGHARWWQLQRVFPYDLHNK